MGIDFTERPVVENGMKLVEITPVRSCADETAYLKLDLPLVAKFAPDWNMLLYYLMRHTAMNGIPKNRVITLRKPFWQLAGIPNKARRRKVLDLMEKHVPPELCQLDRARGRCARVILGSDWPHT